MGLPGVANVGVLNSWGHEGSLSYLMGRLDDGFYPDTTLRPGVLMYVGRMGGFYFCVGGMCSDEPWTLPDLPVDVERALH